MGESFCERTIDGDCNFLFEATSEITNLDMLCFNDITLRKGIDQTLVYTDKIVIKFKDRSLFEIERKYLLWFIIDKVSEANEHSTLSKEEKMNQYEEMLKVKESPNKHSNDKKGENQCKQDQ